MGAPMPLPPPTGAPGGRKPAAHEQREKEGLDLEARVQALQGAAWVSRAHELLGVQNWHGRLFGDDLEITGQRIAREVEMFLQGCFSRGYRRAHAAQEIPEFCSFYTGEVLQGFRDGKAAQAASRLGCNEMSFRSLVLATQLDSFSANVMALLAEDYEVPTDRGRNDPFAAQAARELE